MKESKELKKNKLNIKELFVNRQYRSIMILIFYAVLFGFLIISLRMPDNTQMDINNQDTISKIKGYEAIALNNFGYKYTLKMDKVTYSYEGKKYNNKDLVVLTTGEIKEEYYILDGVAYKNINGVYEENTMPILLFNFFDTKLIERIIQRSTLVDENIHMYEVSNQSLYDLLSNYNDKLQDGKNNLILTYRNSNITRISIDLTNYAKSLGENYSSLVLTLDYFDFNLIENYEISIKNN